MKQIVLIDDSAINLKIAKNALENEYKIIALTSGPQALQYLTAHPADLIILDINMPGMDGFRVLEKLKQSNSNVPVVILSAENDDETVSRARQMGAHDFITKPFTPEQLRERIRTRFIA